jgi:hypothetical protein
MFKEIVLGLLVCMRIGNKDVWGLCASATGESYTAAIAPAANNFAWE